MSFKKSSLVAISGQNDERHPLMRKLQSYSKAKIMAGMNELINNGPVYVQMMNVGDTVANKLGHQDPEVVAAALSVLGLTGHKGEKYEEYIAPMVSNHPDARVRAAAVEALGHLSDFIKAPSFVAKGTEDPEPLVRIKACQAIAESEDTSMHEALAKLLKDPVPEVQSAALHALGSFVSFSLEMQSQYGEKMSEVLATMLGSSRTRNAALDAICDMGGKAPSSCVTAVVASLSDKDGTTRMSAVAAVGSMVDAVALSKEALSQIKDLLNNTDAGVRAAAANALATMGPKASGCAEAVAELLKDENEDTSGMALVMGNGGRRLPPQMRRPKAAAVTALGRMASEPHIAKISEALNDSCWEVRLCAAEALGELKDKAKGEVSAILGSLEDETFPVRGMACHALGQIKDTEALPRLIEAFEDSAFTVRMQAVQALGEMGEASEEFSHEVFKLTNDPVSDVKAAAVRVLPKLGSTGENYAGVVASMVMDDDAGVRLAVCEALSKMGQPGIACSQEVEELLNDPVPAVRYAACETLETLGFRMSPFLKDFGKGPGVPNDTTPYWQRPQESQPMLLPGEINFGGMGIHYSDIMAQKSDLQHSGKWVEGVL